MSPSDLSWKSSQNNKIALNVVVVRFHSKLVN